MGSHRTPRSRPTSLRTGPRPIQAFRETDERTVAMIDEVDVLEDETLLLGLGDLPNVSIVGITSLSVISAMVSGHSNSSKRSNRDRGC